MRFNKIIPILYTKNLNKSIDFYLKILGFEFIITSCNNDWVILRLDDIELMLSNPNDHIPFHKSIFTGSFYIQTVHVDLIWDKLRDHPNISYPLETFDYGMKEFAILDNNGYLLQFGEEISL